MPDTLTPAPAMAPPRSRVEDDVDDIDTHAMWCRCDDCLPDRRHDEREAA